MINFERFAADGNAFLNELSVKMGHPEEKAQAGILLRSVLHVLRDTMTIPQSFHFLAQLPMFLKAIYVEQWKYSEEPIRIKNEEDFSKRVEAEQRKFGERAFNWDQSTIELVKIIIESLHQYVSEGEFDDVVAELPKGIKGLFPEGQKLTR